MCPGRSPQGHRTADWPPAPLGLDLKLEFVIIQLCCCQSAGYLASLSLNFPIYKMGLVADPHIQSLPDITPWSCRAASEATCLNPNFSPFFSNLLLFRVYYLGEWPTLRPAPHLKDLCRKLLCHFLQEAFWDHSSPPSGLNNLPTDFRAIMFVSL